MGWTITQKEIEKYKMFLKEHPIDPVYDEEMEKFDGAVPPEQLAARCIYELLKRRGELE